MFPQIKVTLRKDGREVARFRDSQGLVRTSAGRVDWTRADKIKQIMDYAIALQVAQARAGIGSDGGRMAPLKASENRVFVGREGRIARFTNKTYGNRKSASGLQPIRDLYGFGKGGHMLDDIRINYLDDRRANASITSKVSRDKARGNQKRAPWWGLSLENARKVWQLAGELLPQTVADRLFELDIIGARALAAVQTRAFRRLT